MNALRRGFKSLVYSPLTRMLVAKMVLNIIVTEGIAPSMNSSRSLALRPNLLLPTKCNVEAALKANHFRRLGIIMRNLKTITDVIVLNIPRRTFLEHCREWYKSEIDFPKHTHAPSTLSKKKLCCRKRNLSPSRQNGNSFDLRVLKTHIRGFECYLTSDSSLYAMYTFESSVQESLHLEGI
jgi:hypothetical protein